MTALAGSIPTHAWSVRETVTRPDEVGLVRDDDQAGAVAGLEFGHDAADVGTDRFRADNEFSGDFIVAEPAGDVGEHFTFPFGEVG